MFSLVALLIIFAAVIGSAAMVGILAYFLSRIRRLEGGMPGDQAPRQLTDQMDTMVEELMALQGEVNNLSERLDFTEKLLMTGDGEAEPGDS
ncbi:MAG: hypothetical protein HKO65_05845 [Gemmatimonadetes bacterium]|nr:hypothetical protein [Gemmatimonadota bacterium]NNM04608.1 hypothetical protein [Gemmatimonadota bacterium]